MSKRKLHWPPKSREVRRGWGKAISSDYKYPSRVWVAGRKDRMFWKTAKQLALQSSLKRITEVPDVEAIFDIRHYLK